MEKIDQCHNVRVVHSSLGSPEPDSSAGSYASNHLQPGSIESGGDGQYTYVYMHNHTIMYTVSVIFIVQYVYFFSICMMWLFAAALA